VARTLTNRIKRGKIMEELLSHRYTAALVYPLLRNLGVPLTPESVRLVALIVLIILDETPDGQQLKERMKREPSVMVTQEEIALHRKVLSKELVDAELGVNEVQLILEQRNV
jgi:hypothetical protein